MVWPEDSVEPLLKGVLVLAGCVLLVVAAGIFALVLAPFAVGLAIVYPYFKWKQDEIDERRHREYQREVEARRYHEEQKKEREKQEWIEARLQGQKWREEAAMEIAERKLARQRELQALQRKEEEERAKKELERLEKGKKLFNGSFETLDSDVFLESKLSSVKRGELFAKNYKRLKISPFGDSGSAFYWVYPRHNESKEHAFFSYLIKALLEVYAEEVWLCATRGPDVIVKHENKRFCFDVETGSNWARRRDWVKRKFHYYGKEYDKSFIFVTSKKLKFKYSKLGIVVTRGTLRKTITELFKNKRVDWHRAA